MAHTASRSGIPPFTSREAAYVADVPEKTVSQAVDRGEIAAARRGAGRNRTVGWADLVYLRLRASVGRLLTAEARKRLRREIPEALRTGRRAVALGPVTVSLEEAMRAVEARARRIETMQESVTADPAVLAGEPTVRGTRISAYVLADLAKQGAGEAELLEDYPSLTGETLAAALLVARLHPRRGRPRRAPWKRGSGPAA